MSALPPNDPNQNPFTHQEVERWRKGHKPLPMSRDPDRERRHRRQSLIQDAIARVRATQHAYNAPDPPSKSGFTWHVRRDDASVSRMLVNHPDSLWTTIDGRYLGLGSSELWSNHDGPSINSCVAYRRSQKPNMADGPTRKHSRGLCLWWWWWWWWREVVRWQGPKALEGQGCWPPRCQVPEPGDP